MFGRQASKSFIDAGTSALTSLVGAFGNAEGKAIKKLMEGDSSLSGDKALEMIKAGKFDKSQLRQIARGNFSTEGDVINVLPKSTDGLFGADGAIFGSEGFFGKDGALRGDDGLIDDIGGFLGIGEGNEEGVFGSGGFFGELFQSLGLSKPK